MRNHRISLTARLTLLFAASAASALILMGLVMVALVDRHFEELDIDTLAGNLAFLARTLEDVRSPEQLAALPRQLANAFAGQPALSVTVLDSNGRVVLSSGRPELAAMIGAPRGGMAGATSMLRTPDGRHFRVMVQSMPVKVDGGSPLLAVAATDMGAHERFAHNFQLALWSLIVIAAMLTGVLGWFSAHRGLMPLKRIRKSAADITASRLDQRLASESIPAELAEVVDTLNEMLARLQESFQRISDFSSDLAHELRTPVGNLLTQTQVALSKARTPEQYRDILASNGEELERLARTISDMLFLAQAENALIVPGSEPVDLVRQTQEVFDFYDALAAEKRVRLTLVGSGTVIGDSLMLRRALTNLLSNAVRHTPPDGSIAVRIETGDDGTVTLSVENTGETVAPEHLARLFDRFYRVSSSRERMAEGSGLGLAITRSIVRAHGGTVAASSENGRTRFDLRMPSGGITGHRSVATR